MKVSAVMPCRGRQEWAAQAVEVFLSQTYPNKELVILDDGELPSFPNGVTGEGIRYYSESVTLRHLIPAKRNMVNALATGDVIWHLDSDDYSSPDRMTEQVHRLEQTGKAVTGYYEILFYRESDDTAFEYRSTRNWVCGSSLCYLKSFWEQHPFKENKFTGSDNHFVTRARDTFQLDSTQGHGRLVARIHADNTSKKERLGPEYQPVLLDRIPAAFPGLVRA